MRDRNDPTYQRVRGKYDDWSDANPPKRSGSALAWPEEGLPIPELSERTARVVFTAVGLGIGVLVLALAVVAFVASRSWAEIDRGGATTGYALPVLFLTVSGLGCILATLNHQFRVARGGGGHH